MKVPILLLIAAWSTAAPLMATEQNQVPWVKDLPTAMELARQRNLLVLVHFTSESCPPCRRLEQQVFNQPYFGHAVSQLFVPVCVNVSLQPKISSDYQVQSWPTDIVLTHTGEELHRMVSPQDGSQYLRTLQQVAWNYQQHQSSSAILARYREGEPRTQQSTTTNAQLAQMMPNHRRSAPTVPGGQMANYPNGNGQSIYGTQSPNGSQGFPQRPVVVPAATQRSAVASNSARMDTMYQTVTEPPPQIVENPYLASPPTASVQPPPQQEAPQMASAAPIGSPAADAPIAASANQVQGTSFISTSGPVPTEVAPLNSFGLDGYCPVAVMDENKWVAGNRQWGAQHRGRVYLFRDAASQQQFLANPERYAPALAGFDPVVATESGQYTPGRREHGVRYNDRMYLFGSEESLQKFSQTPDEYVARIAEAMQGFAAR